MSPAFALGTAKWSLPTSSSTQWDDIRSYRTGWRPSELGLQSRRARLRDSSITRGTSAPGPGSPALPLSAPDLLPLVFAPHSSQRRGHLVGDRVHLLGRPSAEEAPRSQALDGSGSRMPVARALA